MTRRRTRPLALLSLALLSLSSACDKTDPSAPAPDASAPAPASEPSAKAETPPSETPPAPEAANADTSDAPPVSAEADAVAEAPAEAEIPAEAPPPSELAGSTDPSFADAVAKLAGGEAPSETAKQTAWTHYKAGEYSDAQKHFGLAALHEPGTWKHPFNLACAASLAKDELMTRVALREAMARDPSNVGDKAMSEGDLAEYRNAAWFKQLLGLDPNMPVGLDDFEREAYEREANLKDPRDIPLLPPLPVAAKVSWREVSRPAEALSMINLAGGVLAKGASGYYDVSDDGQLVMRAEIEPPAAELLGHWPDNAWYVERREVKDKKRWIDDDTPLYEIRLMRLRQQRRWVPQKFLDEQRWEDHGEVIHLAGKGGLLVYSPDITPENDADSSFFSRVADTVDDALPNEHLGELVYWVTTKSGRFYSISDYQGKLVATKACEEDDCAALEMRELPKGSDWSFGEVRTRKRHSVSFTATYTGSEHHVLHYESGGWKLNPMPSAVTGLWATDDGGLWVQLGAELWHRDPSGSWRDIELPAGASQLSVAMRGDRSELWIAVSVGGKTVVYATAANAQAPAP